MTLKRKTVKQLALWSNSKLKRDVFMQSASSFSVVNLLLFCIDMKVDRLEQLAKTMPPCCGHIY